MELEEQVKKANKDFYNIVGSCYESIDGRRSEGLTHYVSKNLQTLPISGNREALLDIGCGSGFVGKVAKDIFRTQYALDISHVILHAIEEIKNLYKISADTDFLPFKNDSFNGVVTFAVLHHCYAYKKMFSEIYRVLKKGGVYYSDHDMDALFFKRFKLLLNLYRKLNDASSRYLKSFGQLSKEIYDYSEFHQDGISTLEIGQDLKEIGFSEVKIEYHWYGLSRATDALFQNNNFKQGYAPLVRITAIK